MDHPRRFRVGYWLGTDSLQYGGVGPYALRTLRALLAEPESEWEFVLLCHAESQETVNKIISSSQQATEVHLIPQAIDPTSSWQQRILSAKAEIISRFKKGHHSQTPLDSLKIMLEHLRLDLIHFPVPTPPYPQESIPYHVPPLLETSVPYIVTTHDVQELRFPEYFSPAQRAIRAMHHWKSLDRARKIIVSYNHIKIDLIKYFGLPEDKVQVCPHAYRSISLPEPSPAAARVYSDRYESWKPFLLYPAQTWRHKNHISLVDALDMVRQRHHLNIRLICTGHLNEYQKEIARHIEKMDLNDAVLFTGILPEDELCWLYNHTALVTIPTEYEAGSYPLLEAIMQGAPVICSNVTSLPETIADPRFVFNPYDIEGLSKLIFRMLTDRQLCAENVANSWQQATRLRSVNAAAYFYATYRTILTTP